MTVYYKRSKEQFDEDFNNAVARTLNAICEMADCLGTYDSENYAAAKYAREVITRMREDADSLGRISNRL